MVGIICKAGKSGNKKITIKKVIDVLMVRGIVACEKKGKKAKSPLILAKSRKKSIT
jgi:hypothetical protein